MNTPIELRKLFTDGKITIHEMAAIQDKIHALRSRIGNLEAFIQKQLDGQTWTVAEARALLSAKEWQ